MSLLELDHVSKFYGRGARTRVALREVSFELDAGELVAVWGMRRSGRSTLLRVAAGVQPPDIGAVRFRGGDLHDRGATIGDGIAYCRRVFPSVEGQHVIDQLMTRLLARGVRPGPARGRARSALDRVDAAACATLAPAELGGTEAARVALALGLATEPSLIVFDEPTIGVDLLERDEILLLLRSLADEGMAVLISAGETPALSGADRALTIADGRLQGPTVPKLARVLPLRHAIGMPLSA